MCVILVACRALHVPNCHAVNGLRLPACLWDRQVKKWLGQERVRFMKLTNGPSAVDEVNNFKCGTVWKLLIASYEVRPCKGLC